MTEKSITFNQLQTKLKTLFGVMPFPIEIIGEAGSVYVCFTHVFDFRLPMNLFFDNDDIKLRQFIEKEITEKTEEMRKEIGPA